MENKKTKVRFAPAPTTPLNILGARIALYNYLFAKKNNGEMVLRFDDMLSGLKDAEEDIINSLNWLGIEYTGGIIRQSERRETYDKYMNQLLENGYAYYAFDTPEKLNTKRKKNVLFNYADERMSMCNSLTLSESEVSKFLEQGNEYVIRLKAEKKDIIINDIIAGEQNYDSSFIGDVILYASGNYTFHFTDPVDDFLIGITHVIRGHNLMPFLANYVLIFSYLGWEKELPLFGHLPIVCNPEGQGNWDEIVVAQLPFPFYIKDFKKKGYLPEDVRLFISSVDRQEKKVNKFDSSLLPDA